MVFRSRVDAWLVWLVRLPMLGALAVGLAVAVRQPRPATWTILVLGVLIYAVVEWVFTSTYYMVDQDFLRVRSGPFRSRMLISDMRTISRADRRLEIRDGSGRSIVVSPSDDELFVEALRSVNGKIELVNR